MENTPNTPLDPFVYNNSFYPTDLAASQYYYQSGGSSNDAEQIQQIILTYAELKGVEPQEIVEGLKSLSEEEASEQLRLMVEEIEDVEYQRQIEEARNAAKEQEADYNVEEEAGTQFDYDPEEFIARQEMIMQNQQQEANNDIIEEEEKEPTEAESYLSDGYKYGGAKKKFISKLKKAMGGMDVVKMPQADFNKNNYGENMLGSFVQGVQNNSKKALIKEAAENVEKTISQNPEMLLAPMAQFGMQMYNPMSTLSDNANAGMDYINSRMPSNQAMMNSFGNAVNQFLNDTGIGQAANDQQQTLRYGGDLPKAQSLGNFNSKMFKPSPVTGKYSWEGKSRNSLLNNPNLPRVSVIKGAPKKEVGNHWVNNVQAPDSFLENILEFVDPTGYLSYDDAARADSSFKASGRTYPTLDELVEMFGVLPVLGKIKYLKAVNGLKKSKSYGYLPLQQLINAFDSSRDIIDDNLGDVDIKAVPSRTYPYRQGGSLPTAQGGREYARKLWEQQYGKNYPDAQKLQAFDDFYSRMNPEVWDSIASQMSNVQSASNMFNYVPGLGQNPWGYRSFNNPYLQQYAYRPRWYAQKPGSNKKINIRNLSDWSNADLVQTEQMTNRRGKIKGYRYTLQKPDVQRQPSPDSGYVVPNVEDVMLNTNPSQSLNTGMTTGQGSAPSTRPELNYDPSQVVQQKGGQLYLYRDGGLPKFQGPEASELTGLKPRSYGDPFNPLGNESNTITYKDAYPEETIDKDAYPEETIDIVQTTKPNFLQGVARAMPYMNFANNIYDRISAENQRNKLRKQATSIEGIVSPISDYKGRFSEYGAYQPNLQGFQGVGSAKFGGNIGDGEYYLSDSEIQDIINMGGEVEFLED